MSEQPLSRRARRARDRQQPEWLADMPEGLSDEEKAAYEEEMAAAARRERTRSANRSRRAADSPVDAIRTTDQDQQAEPADDQDETELVPQVEQPGQKPADATVLQSLIAPAEDAPEGPDEPAPVTEGQQLLPVEEFTDAEHDPLVHDADLAGLVSEDDVADLVEEETDEPEPVAGQLELDLSVEEALAERDRTPTPPVPGLATSTNLFASAIDPALLAEQSRLAEIADTITSRVQIAGGAPGPTEDLAQPEDEATGSVPVIEADEAAEETDAGEEDLEIDLSPLEELHRGTDPDNLPDEQEPGREFDTSTLSHSAIIPAVAAELDGEANRLTELTEEPSFDAVIGSGDADDEAPAQAHTESGYAAEHPVEAQRAHGLEPQEQSTGFDFGLVSTSSLIVAGIGLLALIVAIVLFIIN